MKTVIESTKVGVLSIVEKRVNADIYMVRDYMEDILSNFDAFEVHEDGDISVTFLDNVERMERGSFINAISKKVVKLKLQKLANHVGLFPKRINGERVGYYINLDGLCLGTIDLENYIDYYEDTFNQYTTRELTQISNMAIILLAKKQREVK